MSYISCRLKALDKEGTYEIELVNMEAGGGLFKTIKDKNIDGAVSGAMSKVFSLFGVKVFWMQYYPRSNCYHWTLGDGCVVHTPAQLRNAGLTRYRQMILRDFLRTQAFVENS